MTEQEKLMEGIFITIEESLPSEFCQKGVVSDITNRVMVILSKMCWLKGNQDLPEECQGCARYRQFSTGVNKLMKAGWRPTKEIEVDK